MSKSRGFPSFTRTDLFQSFVRNTQLLLGFLLLISLFTSLVYTYTRATSPQTAYAATSSNLNYQARLFSTNGNVVPDGYYNVEFNLYDADSGGSPLWSEEYYDSNGATAGNDNRVRVVNGYFSVNLGSQTAFPSNIDWDQELWLTLNVGGSTHTATPTYDGEMDPRIKLTAVPYAFKAGQLIRNDGDGDKTTLDFEAPSGSNSILLPAASGTVCLTSGNCAGVGGTGDILQGGNNFGAAVTIGTNDSYGLNLEVNNSTVGSFSSTGQATFKNTTNSTTAFQIQNSASESLFTVDTQNAQITTTDLKPLQAGALLSPAVTSDIPTDPGAYAYGVFSGTTWSAVGSDGFTRTLYIDEYYDEIEDEYINRLSLARCTDADCSSPVLTTISDTSDYSDYYGGATMDIDGNLARIGYREYDEGADGYEYKFVNCTNEDCSTSTVETIFNAEASQYVNYGSIDLDSDGFARFSLGVRNESTQEDELHYIRCTNSDCSTSTTETLWSTYSEESLMTGTNIVLNGDDIPYISYSGLPMDLGLLRCDDEDCASFGEIFYAESWAIIGHDLSLDSNGNPVMAFVGPYDADRITISKCTDELCESNTTNDLPQTPNIENQDGWANLSMVLDSSDNPNIAFLTDWDGLGYIHCNDEACANPSQPAWIDVNRVAPGAVDMVLGLDGFARIVYGNNGIYDNDADEWSPPGKLRLARLNNASGAKIVNGTNIGTDSTPFGGIYAIQMSANILNLQGDGAVLNIADSQGNQMLTVDTFAQSTVINTNTFINGYTEISDSLLVFGNIAGDNGLSINGNTNLWGELSVNDTMWVHGDTTDLYGNLKVTAKSGNHGYPNLFEVQDEGDSGSYISIMDGLFYAERRVNTEGTYISGNTTFGNLQNESVFSDTFESGNLNLWNSVSGDVTISGGEDWNTETHFGPGKYAANVAVDNGPSEARRSVGEHDSLSISATVFVDGPGAKNLISIYNSNGDRFTLYLVDVDEEGSMLCLYNGATSTDTCQDGGARFPYEQWVHVSMNILPTEVSGWPDDSIDAGFSYAIPRYDDDWDGGLDWVGGSILDDSGIGTDPYSEVGIGDPDGAGISQSFKVDNIGVSKKGGGASSVLIQSSLVVGGSSVFNNQLLVQDTSGSSLLYVDGTASSVILGQGVMFTLGSDNTDPAGTNGSMYYNTSDNKFRCYENGTWVDCIGAAGGGGDLLQGGNEFGADMLIGTNDEYNLSFVTNETIRWTIDTDGHFIPSANDTYDIGSDTNRVRDLYVGGETIHIGSSTSDEATISYNATTDSLIFKNATNSTSAFDIQNSSGTSLFTVDSTNNEIEFNTSTKLIWGGDTNLYRLNSNILATDDRFLVFRGIDTDIAFDARITGDNAPRFQAQAGGKLLFGDGTNAADTNLYRSAANTLMTDDAFTVAGLLTGQTGATISGAAISLNASSNFATNINTGTSTGAVSIGNTAAGAITLSSGAASSFTTNSGNLTLQAGSGTVSLGSSTTLTSTGALSVSAGGTAQNLNLNASTSGTINIGGTSTGDILIGGGSSSTGCTVTNSNGNFACAGTITAAGILNANATGKTAITVADSGAQNSGITIGGDTNLYRSAANTLKTDDNFIVQPASNSTSTFIVANSGGTNNVLQVDTTNSRVAIGVSTTAPAQRLTVNAGANYGWNDYIGLTDGTRTAQIGLLNSSGGIGFRSGGNADWEYSFYNAAGTSALFNINEFYRAELNIAYNEVLRLNSLADDQSYMTFAVNATDRWQIGADYNGDFTNNNFFIYDAMANEYRLQIDQYGSLIAHRDGYFNDGIMSIGDQGPSGQGGLKFGYEADTNLYRSAANNLMTDDSMTVNLNLSVNGNTTIGDSSSDTATLNAETVFSDTANVSFAPQTVNTTSTTLTLTPTSSFVLLGCNRASNANTAVTLSETGARAGQLLIIVVDGISNQAGTCSWADVNNVQQATTTTLDNFDSKTFIYDGAQWVQTAESNN